MKYRIVLVLCSLLATSLISHAQGLGTIVGTVSDSSGASIASAQVTVTQTGTGVTREVTANTEGYYVVPSLVPSSYTIQVKANGFRESKQDVTLLADQTLTVNVGLQVGKISEVVEVAATAVQVDTSTATLKQVIEERRIAELPLNGRNPATLTLLVAGAVNSPNGGADQGATKTFPGAVTYSTNGTRQDTIAYQLDGGNYVDEYTNVNQPFPFPDALQEFSVQTSNYSAEYGQNAGGVVNVVTKSGTNQFHGDAFEFVRNPIFNAQNYFATPTAPDRVKRNQFGGTFGGPIVRNKTFFFAGYQRTAFRNLALSSSSVVGQTDIANFLKAGPFGTPGIIDPSIASLIGVIPGCSVVGCGPSFNANAGQVDPNAKFALSGAPPAGASPTVAFSKPDTENFDSGMGRLDHSFTEHDKLTARYEYDRFVKLPVFNPMQLVSYTDATFSIVAQNALLHETHVFSSRFISDARFGYSREVSTRGPSSNAASVKSFGVPLPFQPTPNAIQGVGVQGGFSFGDNPQGLFIRNNFNPSEDLIWEKGKHDIRFGAGIERSQVNLVNQFNQPGIFGFGTADNYLGLNFPNAKYELFLAGILSDGSSAGNGYAFQQGAGEFKQNRNTFMGFYFQDNLHATRRLTLNLGLRYEPALPWRDNGDRWAQVNLAAMTAGITSRVYPNAPPGIFFSAQNGVPSDPGMPKNALNSNLKGFMPRVGFAYDVFGDGKTSLRGGGGIFYDTRVMGMLSNRFVDEWPFSPQYILTSNNNNGANAASSPGFFSDPLCTKAATQAALKCNGTQAASYPTFPSPFPAPQNFAYVPRFNEIAVSYDPTGKYHVPTVYEWNLTVERQLPASVLARLAYVGSHSIHILETQDYNPGTYNPAKPGTAGTGLASLLVQSGSGGKFGTNTFSTVQADITDINSVYHALQGSLEKRMSHGLTILANYTYSKSLDDLPFGEGVSGFDNGYSALPFNNPNRHRFDYGPSGFDHRHVFTGSYVWQTPSLHSASGLVRHLLGDYELGGIISAQTGRPFTVLQGQELSGTGIGNDRGTLIAGADPYGNNACAGVSAKCVSWLNPAAFMTFNALKGPCGPPATAGCILPTFGNISKNSFRLPGMFNWDVQLSKYFSITERWKVQLRGEYFNVLNHTNFAPESTSCNGPCSTDNITSFDKLNSSSYGQFRAGQAADPRIAQLAMKLIF